MGSLTIICGPAGAGKSTYGRNLAVRTGACLLDSDTVTEAVVRAGMTLGGKNPDDRDSPTYRRAFRNPVYECLFATAAENLTSLDVILVGPFSSEIRDVGWPDQLRERLGVEVEIIYLTCGAEERRRRIEARANPRDAWKLENWENYLESIEDSPPVFDCKIVR